MSQRLANIELLKKQYFDETRYSVKTKLKEQIDRELQDAFGSSKKALGYHIDFDFRIFFSEVFRLKAGFDIVIGNPPYISAIEFADKYGAELRDTLNRNYKSARGTYDIYVLFIEKGLQLTCKNGCLSFITPNKYLSANYGIALREYILNQYSLIQIVDLSAIRVFDEVSVYPIISTFRNAGTNDTIKVLLPPNRSIEIFSEFNFNQLDIQRSMLSLLPENLWGFLLSNQVKLLMKLVENSDALQKFGDVIATSTAKESDEYGNYIKEGKQPNSNKLVNTGTIDKWSTTWGLNDLTHSGKHFSHPYICLEKISQRRLEIYGGAKILFSKMAKTCEAFLDINGEYASLNTNCFYKPREGISIKTIAAICNSKVFMFLYGQLFGALRMSGGYFQFQAPQLRIMPIRYPKTTMQENINVIVDRVLETKLSDPMADTTPLEKMIDNLIFQLYELTDDEIRIVETEV